MLEQTRTVIDEMTKDNRKSTGLVFMELTTETVTELKAMGYMVDIKHVRKAYNPDLPFIPYSTYTVFHKPQSIFVDATGYVHFRD